MGCSRLSLARVIQRRFACLFFADEIGKFGRFLSLSRPPSSGERCRRFIRRSFLRPDGKEREPSVITKMEERKGVGE
jgi:hypothetical protein